MGENKLPTQPTYETPRGEGEGRTEMRNGRRGAVMGRVLGNVFDTALEIISGVAREAVVN